MIHPESVKQWEAETEYFQGRIGALKAENAKLRQSIRALIEVYAPHERKAILLREHLSE